MIDRHIIIQSLDTLDYPSRFLHVEQIPSVAGRWLGAAYDNDNLEFMNAHIGTHGYVKTQPKFTAVLRRK